MARTPGVVAAVDLLATLGTRNFAIRALMSGTNDSLDNRTKWTLCGCRPFYKLDSWPEGTHRAIRAAVS